MYKIQTGILKNKIESRPIIIFISAILALFAAALSPYYLLAFSAIAFIFLVIIYEEKAFLFSLLTGFLVTSSDLSPVLRMVITVGGIAGLVYYFLKYYGADLKAVPQLPKPVMYLLAFYIAASFISSVFSANIVYCIGITIRLIVFLAICYLFFALIKGTETILLYLNALVFSGVILSYGILYDFYKSGFAFFYSMNGEFIRISGIHNNINSTALIIAIGMLIAASFLSLPALKNKMLSKSIYSLALLMMLAALFLTNSRAAILCMITGTIFILYSVFKRKFITISIISIAALFIISIVTELGDTILLYFRLSTVFSAREYLWNIAYDIISDNPILGVGPEMSRFYIDKYFPASFGSWEESEIRNIQNNAVPGMAHNLYLSSLSELGISGLIIILLLISIFSYFVFKLKKNYSHFNLREKVIIMGLTSIGVGMFFRSLVETNGVLSYGWIMSDLPFWICFMCLLNLYKKFKQSESILQK